MDGLFPRLDAPSRTPSPSSQLSVVVHVHDLKHMSTQDHVVYLPRSTGLRTTFAEIKAVVAVKARVEEDRVANGKVDGMTVSMKSSPEQYGVSDGEVIEFSIRAPSRNPSRD